MLIANAHLTHTSHRSKKKKKRSKIQNKITTIEQWKWGLCIFFKENIGKINVSNTVFKTTMCTETYTCWQRIPHTNSSFSKKPVASAVGDDPDQDRVQKLLTEFFPSLYTAMLNCT